MRAEILLYAKQFEASSLGNCLVSELFSSSLRHLGNSWNDDGDYIPQDFGEDGVSCLSKEDFDTLATGEDIGVSLSAWSAVKLESEEISTFV